MQRLLKKFGVFFNRRSTLTENQCIGMKGESLARKYLKKEKKL